MSHGLQFDPALVHIEQAGDYDRVTYEGAQLDLDADHAGYPQLPVLTCRFILPPETKVEDLETAVLETVAIPGEYWPIPVQPLEEDDGGGGFIPPDSLVYGSEQPFPERPIRLTVDGHMRGYHVAAVQVWPLQYVGALRQLRVLTQVRIGATVIPLAPDESARLFRRLREDWRPWELRSEVRWILNHVLNPEDFDPLYRTGMSTPQRGRGAREERPFGGFRPTEFPSLEGPPVAEVIITDDRRMDGTPLPGMLLPFQDWADWLTEKGVPAVVKTVSWIEANYAGIDRPERIRNFVKDAAEKWGTDFVMLGGDLDVVPSRLLGGPANSNLYRADPPGDTYYGELDASWNADADAYFAEDGDDFPLDALCDLWVGRIPAVDAAEATQILEKVAVYERRPGYEASFPDPEYCDDILLAAGPTNSWCDEDYGVVDGIEQAEDIIDVVEPPPFAMDVTRMYPALPDPALAPTCNNLNPPGPVQCFHTMRQIMHDGWDIRLTAANFADALNLGVGWLFHCEHSTRDMLGCLSNESVTYYSGCTDCPSAPPPDWVWDGTCKNAFKAMNPGYGPDLTRQVVDDLTNGDMGRHTVVVSIGSHVNQFDMDGVAEHCLRNARGGAVAFFGKTASHGLYGGTPSRDFFHLAFPGGVVEAGQVAALATNEAGEPSRAGIIWRLLGDPEMPLWTQVPASLQVTCEPGVFARLGAQPFVVTVRSGQQTVAGARVCLKQADLAYAVAWTDDTGQAVFPAFTPMSWEDISAVATARNCMPARTFIERGGTPLANHVAYSSHETDDSVIGGDGDGVLEAGETVEVSVTARNLCQSQQYPVPDVTAHLWPAAPIVFDLAMTGGGDSDYEPEDIYIGDQEAHPSAVADTFRIPANWEAIRPERMPEPGILDENSFLLWRDTERLWHLRAEFVAGDQEILSGDLTTWGGFSDDVATNGTEPEDELVFNPDSPNTIAFTFTPDEDADELTFHAEAVAWLEVETPSVALGEIPCQGTASGAFQVSWTGAVPDRDEAVFTLAACDENQNWWFSDFSETIHAPAARYLVQKTQVVQDIVGWRLKIWPTLSNLGGAPADNSVALLTHVTPGEFIPVTTELEFGAVAPGDTLQSGSHFEIRSLTSSDFTPLRYWIELRTFQPNGDCISWIRQDMHVHDPKVPTPAPSDPIADESGGAIHLRWSPPNDVADLEGYHVFQLIGEQWVRLTRAPLVGTSRYEISGLPALDPSGDPIDYSFSVNAVDLSGNQSVKISPGEPARVNLPELDGWPQRMRGGSMCVPKVFDLDGDGDFEILAAGQEIYAWHHNGDPVLQDPQHSDGLFFDPFPVDEDSPFQFMEALGVWDIDRNGKPDVVGNLGGHSVRVVEYDRTGSGSVTERWTLPVNSALAPPILADLDNNGGDLEVLLPGDKWVADHEEGWVYVWSADGSPRNPQHSDGRFIESRTPSGTCAYDYRSLAVGELRSLSPGLEIVQSLRLSHYVSCYSSIPSQPAILWRGDVNTGAGCGSGGNRQLTTPMIGNVDGDLGLEVVATMSGSSSGGVMVLTGFSGFHEACISGSSFRFMGSWGGDDQAAPAALADMDGDGSSNLEILVGGGESGGYNIPARTLRLHSFDKSGGVLTDSAVDDYIPIPGARVEDTRGEAQPVAADVDGDGNLEVFLSNNSGYLACYERASGELRAERGWPRSFPDVPMSPAVVDLDGCGKLEMVVVDRSGTVHVLGLTGSSEGAALPWPEYGHDPRNTFNAQTSRWPGRGEAEDPPVSPVVQSGTPFAAGPNPMRAVGRFEFWLPTPGHMKVEVCDLLGRQVCTLVDRDLPAGQQVAVWDGRSRGGKLVPSGVYFVRLVNARGVQVRRLLVVR